MSTTVALLAPLIGGTGVALITGGVRWLRAVTAALGKLTDVAETQAQTAAQQVELQRQLGQVSRTCDNRWHRLSGIVPHPRWADADDRVPETT